MTAPITLPYFTGSGHTAKLAEAVASGIANAHLIDIEHMTSADWDALDASPAIIFGTPTYMGSSAARYDHFLEEASDRWPDQLWANKIAGGFTVATYPSGDKLSALFRLVIYATQMGMLWIGPNAIGAPVNPASPGVNRDGANLGMMATSSRDKTQLIDQEDVHTAQLYGARIDAAVTRWTSAERLS